MNIIRTYTEGIIDRLTEEGAIISETPLVSAHDGSFAVFTIDIGGTDTDDYMKFAHSFAEDNYPNEFQTPSPTAVQIVLNLMDRSYKDVSMEVAAMFYLDEMGRSVVMFRILSGTVYMRDGSKFRSPILSDVIGLVTELENRINRIVPEVGDI